MSTSRDLPSLRNFEDDDTSPLPTLTPRRRTQPRRTQPRRAAPQGSGVDDVDALSEGEPTPIGDSEALDALVEPAGSSDVQASDEPAPGLTTKPEQPSTRRRGRPLSSPQTPDLTRPSNVSIPAALLPKVKQRRDELGLTTGELIIAAIEATASRLGELVAARPSTGGSLFTRRATAITRQATPQSSLNFRLRPEDFEVLDQLVDQHGAASRSQMVAAALADYLT